ncbi:VasE superfamily type VI secretion protein (plasmid) [Candidatus Trichorickettsia mobilis]|uniref:type VI secretion system baseplate subunit TssK n=1 Tax=Candidatus Trichorickettsia mobilis TaxID=1346319 RepID=UPI002B25CE4B|nr:type VI secretion system baseplate subunit TssK [Candidatus Trichorickettsia mobilis]WPY01673.1 VasE superfamily type VI secretion protein [Candidatus Trichorickettsia mobilis]
MIKANKVFWKDGMFMYPQHFQQQDFYYENLINNYQSLQPYPNWGILKLEIDESYLSLNKVLLRKCSGILPNGMFFDIPNRDNLPQPIEIPKGYNNKLVYLGIPINNNHRLNPIHVDKTGFRYYGEEEGLPDNNSDNEEKQNIALSKLNLNFFLEEEDSEQIIKLPLIKIISSDEGIKQESNYIPPCLRLHSSRVILGHINNIAGLLTNYLHTHSSIVGIAETDANRIYKVENLLILQTVSKYKALFDLLSHSTFLTPYHVFEHALCLIASLNIFTKESSAENLSLNYDHLAISQSFASLLKKITAIFHALDHSSSFKYELNNRGDGIYTGIMSQDTGSWQNVELILGLELKNNLEEIAKITSPIKVAAINDIDDIIRLKVSGINFDVLAIPPSYILNQKDTVYLKIEKTGKLWEQVTIHRNFAVYLGQKVNEVKKITLWINPLSQ